MKTIKFNLVCDNHQIRTLEELRNHFSIEDVLQYYRDKVLEKWLTVRGYTVELEAVKNIKGGSPLDIITKLVAIFNVETDKQKIEYATSIIQYREDRILAKEKFDKENQQSEYFYDDYFQKYAQLKWDILRNNNNKTKIQTAIQEISDHYKLVFRMDYRNFFYEIKDKSPLAVLCLLMNPFTRQFYTLEGEGLSDDATITTKDIQTMNNEIQKMFTKDKDIELLGEYIVIKNNETGSRFVGLSENKCMVIKLSQATYKPECAISHANNNENFIKPDSVNGKFLIMEGLQYQSQSSANTLYYIEF